MAAPELTPPLPARASSDTAGSARRAVRVVPGRARRVAAVMEYFATVLRRTWRGVLMSWFGSPLMMLGALGLGLGTLVDSAAGGVGGVRYLLFVAPGVLANQAMITGVGESTYPVMDNFQWRRNYFAMAAAPAEPRDVLLGHLATVTIWLTGVCTVFVTVARVFGAFTSWTALLAVPLAVLTGLAFACPIFAFTATQRTDNYFNVLMRIVITPLALFSGTYFPLGQLPVALQVVGWVSPLWHGVELCRGVALGGAATVISPMAALHLGVLVTYAVVGYLTARRTFRTRLAS